MIIVHFYSLGQMFTRKPIHPKKYTIELRIIQNNECNKMKIKPGTMARSMTMEKRIK